MWRGVASNSESAGKARRSRRYPSPIPTSKPRTNACGAAFANPRRPPLRLRWTHAPAKKPREKASGGGRGPQMKTSVLDEPKDYHTHILLAECERESRGGHRRRFAWHDPSATTGGNTVRGLWGKHCSSTEVRFRRLARSHEVRRGKRTGGRR